MRFLTRRGRQCHWKRKRPVSLAATTRFAGARVSPARQALALSLRAGVACSVILRCVAPVAVVQTEPVPSQSDAADNPAIWSHPGDPALSLVLGTDKKGG
jgi:hypothetical protein